MTTSLVVRAVLKSNCHNAYLHYAPQHFLYFFPLPQGQGSFLPTFGSSRRTGSGRGAFSCTSEEAVGAEEDSSGNAEGVMPEDSGCKNCVLGEESSTLATFSSFTTST